MTENGLEIQTILTKRTDIQADRVLLLGQVTEKEEKAHLSHFLKFLLASHTNDTFGFARHTSQPSAKPKEPFFSQHTSKFLCFLFFNWLFIANAYERTVEGDINRGILWS